MILTKELLVKPRNHAKYWSSNLGYSVNYHDVLMVEIKYFPNTSSRSVFCSCDICGEFFTRSIQVLSMTPVHRCRRCAKAEIARINSNVQKGRKYPEKRGKNHFRWDPNKSKWELYKRQVSRITTSNDLSVLENSDKLRGLCGVDGAYQLDHIIPTRYGFDNNIPPEIIGHIDNLQFIPWEENNAKRDKLIKEIPNGINRSD